MLKKRLGVFLGTNGGEGWNQGTVAASIQCNFSLHFSGKIFGKKHLGYFLKQTDGRDGIMEHSKLNFVGE